MLSWLVAIGGFIKSLFDGKGSINIGKGNVTGSEAKDGGISNSAGRDIIQHVYGSAGGPSVETAPPKSRRETLIDSIKANVVEKPLSQVLPYALELAKLVGDLGFERWVRMELYGYDERGGMRAEDIVPEYRGVRGSHIDHFGRALPLSPKLHFVNNYRLRYDVATLEMMAKNEGMRSLQDDHMRETLFEELNAMTSHFTFNTLGIAAILNTIRNMLLEKVTCIEMGE
jgi:hypothetical protein